VEINKIYQCDIRDIQLPDNSIDLIFTDPPYHKKHLSQITQGLKFKMLLNSEQLSKTP
jgi:DNA modification methylase